VINFFCCAKQGRYQNKSYKSNYCIRW